MKFWIYAIIVVLSFFILARLAVKKFSPAPGHLYSNTGTLAPCPASPNCVSSHDPSPSHAVPFITGDTAAILRQLRNIIENDQYATIITDEEMYLHIEYRSRLLGFVDDLEIMAESRENRVFIRSASRLGHSDFGVNRSRVERLLGQIDPSFLEQSR